MTSAEYQEALKNAAKSMVRVRNPRRLLRMMTRFIDREVGLSHTSILIYESSHNRYIFVDSKGNQKFPLSLIRLDQNNPIVSWFSNPKRDAQITKDYVTEDLLSYVFDDQKRFGADDKLLEEVSAVRDAMRTLRAKVCVPGYYKGELLGILILGEKKSGEEFSEKELSFFQTLTFDAAMAIKNAEYQKTLQQRNDELAASLKEIKDLRVRDRQNFYQVILSLATEVDEKDHCTFGHTAGVVRWGLLLAEELDLIQDEDDRNQVVASLRLHDIGKIGIPDAILKKPARLTDEEFEIMKEHPRKGARILEPLSGFKEVKKAVLYHHENYDGTGYPEGLKGEEIPHIARLVAVVDSFHAMVADRPYHKGMTHEEALIEIERCKDTRYDSEIADAFIRTVRKEIERKSSRLMAKNTSAA